MKKITPFQNRLPGIPGHQMLLFDSPVSGVVCSCGTEMEMDADPEVWICGNCGREETI